MKDDRLKPVITEQPVTASHNVTPSRSAASQPTESQPTASQRTFHQQHISPVTAASTASTVMTSSPATTVTASSFYRVRHVEKNFLPGHELNLNLEPSKHQKTKKKYEWDFQLSSFPFKAFIFFTKTGSRVKLKHLYEYQQHIFLKIGIWRNLEQKSCSDSS